jgi:hypothetical protein
VSPKFLEARHVRAFFVSGLPKNHNNGGAVSSDQHPSNADIIGALHKHDVRLVRLESDMEGLQRDVTAQAGRMDRAAAKLEELAEAVAAMSGVQRAILFIVASGIPIILGLELWDRLGR